MIRCLAILFSLKPALVLDGWVLPFADVYNVLCDAVRVQNGYFADLTQTVTPHQHDVGQGNGQDKRRAPGCGSDGRIGAEITVQEAADVAG